MASHSSENSKSLYFEDFAVSRIFEWGELSVTLESILEFGKLYDPVPIHVDPVAASESIFGGLVASGWQVASLMQRMQYECYIKRSAVISSPGVDKIDWLVPVRPNDRLSLRVEVTEAQISRSRPDRGLVRIHAAVINQKGETVMIKHGKSFFFTSKALKSAE